MSEMHHDHDQRERDIYNESLLAQRKGCLRTIKAVAIVAALVLLCLWLFSGCQAFKAIKEPPVAVPYGPVISIQGDWVEVAFEVINKEPGSQMSGWFYCPLHSYEKGDIFPDFAKYKHPF